MGEERKDLDRDDAVNPKHYASHGKMAPIHIITHYDLGFETGNSVKYVLRSGDKPGESEIRDLKKARWYLDRKIHLLDPDNEPDPAE